MIIGDEADVDPGFNYQLHSLGLHFPFRRPLLHSDLADRLGIRYSGCDSVVRLLHEM